MHKDACRYCEQRLNNAAGIRVTPVDCILYTSDDIRLNDQLDRPMFNPLVGT